MAELNVLVVEDDDLQRKTLYDLITGWEHRARGCEDLADARKALEKESYDMVLLDMRLPDGDGLGLLKEIAGDGDRDMSVVMMTAFADIRTAMDAVRLGAYDYLSKPFEHEHLRKIIRNVSSKVELSRRVNSLSRLTIGGCEDVWQFDGMIGTTALKDIFHVAQRVAKFADATVLILGESGTGKGMLAKGIHRLSCRADKPFVDINCSSIPGQLIESELFGYEKGAFTDAKNSRPGLLEVADGGTVFLDEIGDMEYSMQSKLLKVIEDKEFRRLGSGKTTSVDVRIIAATSRDLKARIAEGKFRGDLYYRLSVIPITLPPLRDHKRSIVPLAEYYYRAFCRETGRDLAYLSDEVKNAMEEYPWPGNVRELRNAVERSVILASGKEISADDLGLRHGAQASSAEMETGSSGSAGDCDLPPMSLADCEKRLITSVMKSVDGNKNRAADVLQIHRTTLYKKLEEYGMK